MSKGIETGYFLFKTDPRYAYAVGRVRSLESRYLTKQDIERLLLTEEPGEAYRFLIEKGYSETESTIKTWFDLEASLDLQRQEVLTLISELSKDAPISNLFRERYDFHNLKVLLKAKYSGQKLDHLLINVGTVPAEILARAVAGEGRRSVPALISHTLQFITAEWEKTNDPQLIDILADCQMYGHFNAVLRPFGNHFLNRWLSMEIDLSNIKTLVRMKWRGLDPTLLRQSLIEGGTVERKRLFSLREATWETVVSSFSKTPYAKVVSIGIETLLNSGSFLQLEKMVDATVISYLKRANLQSLGIEPLIAYLLLKEYELKAVRIVVVGKANGLSAELIREKLPEYP